MNTESNEEKVPVWARTLIEGLVKANDRLAETVKTLQARQDWIEARLEGKPEKENSASKEPTPEEIKKVCDNLFI